MLKKSIWFVVPVIVFLCVSCNQANITQPSENLESPSAISSNNVLDTTDVADIPDMTPAPIETANEDQAYEPIIYEGVNYKEIKPYEAGQVMVIMYHAVVDGESPDSYTRGIDDFENDLQTLYDYGYRLCRLKDLIDNNISVEAGYTPVVITFDDGLPKSYSLTEKDGKFELSENCGLHIMEQFAKNHPGFGCTATLFINGYNDPFTGDATIEQRLNWLVDNGYDIGNHTYNHADLSAKNAEEIQAEIGAVDQLIKDSVSGYTPVGVSYPYGKRPPDELLKYILRGKYNGREYSYTFALREGYNPVKSAVPSRTGFDPYGVSRVRGSNNEETDLGYFLDYYNQNPQYKYISDGNPNTICVPKEYADNINPESTNGKELILYIPDEKE